MTSVSLIEWLWQSSLLLAGCGGLYYGLLRRETCLRYNRLYLLSFRIFYPTLRR